MKADDLWKKRLCAAMLMAGLPLAAVSCTPTVNVHVDPIYAQIDINIKVDRELDSFFDTVAQAEQKPGSAGPATAPASTLPSTPPALAPVPEAAPPAAPETAPATGPTTAPATHP